MSNNSLGLASLKAFYWPMFLISHRVLVLVFLPVPSTLAEWNYNRSRLGGFMEPNEHTLYRVTCYTHADCSDRLLLLPREGVSLHTHKALPAPRWSCIISFYRAWLQIKPAISPAAPNTVSLEDFLREIYPRKCLTCITCFLACFLDTVIPVGA